MRRLEAAKPHVGQLIRGLASEDADRHRIDTSQAQVTVVDIHRLHDRAQRFVVGVMLKGEFERKEASGSPRPLMLVVLDELNKYAPREGRSPIKDVLLDIAERGRSLGIVLIGAQQTASEVEPRVVANLLAARGRPPRCRRGAARRVRLPDAGGARPRLAAQAGHDDPPAAGDPGAAAAAVPVSRLGDAPLGGRADRGPVREVRVRLGQSSSAGVRMLTVKPAARAV